MTRIHLIMPFKCLQPVSPTFRYVAAMFTVLFSLIIILMIAIEVNRMMSTRYHRNHRNTKFRRSVPQPTDIRDSSLTYGVVIDCGSSGSRVFIYCWPKHTGNPKDLLSVQPMRDQFSNAINMKIEPGISDLAKIPQNASNYLEPLLDFALKNIPKERHKETILYVLATAGMRLLPESAQAAIMQDLRTDIPRLYPFMAGDGDFEVITGKQEGVYMWVAINYVLGKFDHGIQDHPLVAVAGDKPGSKVHIRRRTVGILDMGGASMQIAYEVPQATHHVTNDETVKNLMAEVSLGCQQTDVDHHYRVYVATFLKQGANSARQRYEHALAKASANRTLNGFSSPAAIPDPCLPPRMHRSVKLGHKTSGLPDDPHPNRRHFVGTGDFNACRKSLLSFLNLTKSCAKYPCSLNGVYQPTLDLHTTELYGFSEFWYTTDDILGLGGVYNARKFDSGAEVFCSTDWSTLWERFQRKMYPHASVTRLNLQCFKSAWISAVLHDGFRIPRSYDRLHSVNLIDGQPVQWTLGALLHRSRYLPLQEVESGQLRHTSMYRPPWMVSSYISTYIFAICIAIVLIAIVLFIRHLRSASLSHTLGLHRVTSRAFLSTS